MNPELMFKRADSIIQAKESRESFQFYYKSTMESVLLGSLIIAFAIMYSAKSYFWRKE